MPTYDEETRQYLNSGFADRLEAIDNSTVNVIIQVDASDSEPLLAELERLPGVSARAENVTRGRFVPARVPVDEVERIANLDIVEKVHHDQPSGVFAERSLADAIRDFSLQRDPVRERVNSFLAHRLTPTDDLTDEIGIGFNEVPHLNYFQGPLGDPIRVGMTAIQRTTGNEVSGIKFIPTGESVDWILDGDIVDGDHGGNVEIAVLDTGHTPVEPSEGRRFGYIESRVPGEPPLDGHAHGSWCTYTAVGKSAPSLWGRVDGVASGADYSHYKVLNVFPGFGRTSWIMKAMERAVDRGADVVNLSLGAPQQGPVDEDPYCQLIDELCKENLGEDEGAIFVVAAGNSGPGRWTIGSPGVSPKALTVASWSLTDEEPAVYSSRGPQGAYYDEHPDEYASDLASHDSFEFVKPDVAAPGGGRANDELTAELDEMLHQTCAGWLEGMYDGVKDTRGSMKGTSMSAPHVAGLVALLYEAGIVRNAREVKEVVSEQEEIPEFTLATESARETEEGKNIGVGFGPIRESTFMT